MQVTTPNRYLKLERLIEISRLLNQALALQPFLQTLVDQACELTLSAEASILLLEEETGLLKFMATSRGKGEVMKRMRLPLENSVAGQAYNHGQPVIIQDVASHPMVYQEIDQYPHLELRSILAVPIVYGGHPLGAIEVINKFSDAHYTDEDVKILETLAVYAAIVMFNNALLDEAYLAQQNLQDLERMKSDFIAIASHELRTPLGLIIGHATFLQENTNNEQTLKQLDVIIRSATRLKEIVEQMSSLNIHQIGKSRIRRAPVSVSQLIQEVTQSFAESARQKKIALIVDAPPSDLYVEADIEKISLALGNLIDNALTFTNEHGHIWVKAEKLPGHIKVSVIDDGIGIPAKDLHRVFDRFFQVESHATRRHGGMGLGLAVAKVMIELHGGQIWVESVEGKGSNFSFILPAVDHYSNEK